MKLESLQIAIQKTIISLRKHYKLELLYTLNLQILQNNVAEKRCVRAANRMAVAVTIERMEGRCKKKW